MVGADGSGGYVGGVGGGYREYSVLSHCGRALDGLWFKSDFVFIN